MQRTHTHAFAHIQEDIILGRKLATGGFGTVFLGQLRKADGSLMPVVVKKVCVCVCMCVPVYVCVLILKRVCVVCCAGLYVCGLCWSVCVGVYV
jgi:hypothetical protein